MGDLAGPCAFAVLMGLARALYGRFSDRLPLTVCMGASAVLCMGCYLAAALSGQPLLALLGCALCGFSVGIFWPGTFSLAARTLPGGGTAMYALMALAGDLGCSAGPTLVGFTAGAAGGRLQAGLLPAAGGAGGEWSGTADGSADAAKGRGRNRRQQGETERG